MPEMKTLTIGNTTYTIVDEEARKTVANLLDKTEVTVQLTDMTGYLLKISGKVVTSSTGNVKRIVSEPVYASAGDKYTITCSANFGNALYVIYDASGAVLSYEVADSTESGTILSNTEIIMPENTSYFRLASNLDNNPTGYSAAKIVLVPATTRRGKWSGIKWVVIGDSLTEKNKRTTKHYYDYIAEQTGIAVEVMGVSGSGYVAGKDDGDAFYQRVASIPTDADVITIFGSGNDLSAMGSLGLSMGTGASEGGSNPDTVAGYVANAIDAIYDILPTVQLGIIAPTPWQYHSPAEADDEMGQYADMLKDVCKKRGIPYLDLFRYSGLRPWEDEFRTIAYSKDNGDGTHPDETGHSIIAPRIKEFLGTMICQDGLTSAIKDIYNNVVNVKVYGAVGDGITDDTEAIKYAISSINAGDVLYFPAGVYRVSNIDLKSDMTIQGAGWCSVIRLANSSHMYTGVADYSNHNNCLNIEGNSNTPIHNIIVRDIKLDGTRPTQQSNAASQDARLNGIHIRYASDICIENVWMYNNGYHGCIMTYASNVVFERCMATDNGFRPIHGHTKIYDCRITNCICENNGRGLTGGSGFENDSIFFFGAKNIVISDNIVKSNRRGCITVGSEQTSTGEASIIPSQNITISGNVCECYEDLSYVATSESDTGVAKFSSMGIVAYGGEHILDNVSITGNTIKNAHEAIYLYTADSTTQSINAAITGNTIMDCSYGVYATNVMDVAVANNQFKDIRISWMYAGNISKWLINGNNINAPNNSENSLCKMYNCCDVIIQDNNLIGNCAYAFHIPDGNANVVVAKNVVFGFTESNPITNPSGVTTDNLCLEVTNDQSNSTSAEPTCIDPYSNGGFVRHTLANPNTTSSNWYYTTPVAITEADTEYELNTFVSIPNSYSDPSTYDYSSLYTGIVFLSGTDLSTAVGIISLKDGGEDVTFSDTCINGTSNNVWGVRISISSENVESLYPTATHIIMQVEKAYHTPDDLSSAFSAINDGHAYVYRIT